MNTVSISDIHKDHIIVDSCITVSGWIRSCRKSKSNFSFLIIYDGSCFHSMQIFVSDILCNYKNEILRLTIGCSVKIQGILVLSLGKEQKYEIQAKKLTVLGWVENPNTYPISAKKHSKEYLREVAHLRSRTNFIGCVSRIRHHALQTLHIFLSKEGYCWVPTPIITGLNTEGSGSMFRVSTLDLNNISKNKKGFVDFKKDFFGKESFLTVSGQLNLESYACSLSKVYTFGPTFRAENSNTSRHLSEFWMLEVESAFYELHDISYFAEKMLKSVFESILLNCASDIHFLNNNINDNLIQNLENWSSVNFFRIDYSDAIKILNESNSKYKNLVAFGIDLSSEHERYLVENYFKSPLIIKNYPKELKAFYMRLNDDNKTVAAMDILVPGIGELIGGSQREERINVLDLRLLEFGLKKEEYWWYRDLRRYGTVPHSGFGMGFERLISYVTGVSNIRDVIPFPRTANNAKF